MKIGHRSEGRVSSLGDKGEGTIPWREKTPEPWAGEGGA